MPSQSVLRWRDGQGWLILAGGATTDIRAQALGRASADGGVACIALDGNADALLDDLEDLGAPSGYIVEISEDDETLFERLTDASLIVVIGGDDPLASRAALRGTPDAGIQAAYEHGAVILWEGSSAGVLGDWLLTLDGGFSDGMGWLVGCLALPGATDVAALTLPFLETQPNAITIGIGASSALALGPLGEIELWGDRQVTIALGKSYHP